jgi:serine/threonine protein kinase
MVTCSGCGAVCPENVRFCASCGRAIPILDTPTLELDRNAVVPKPAPPSSRPPRSGGFSPGTVLVERYRIVALLGRGGMGEVYRAEDLKLGNVVALKFLPASLQNDAAALAGFHAEVRNARQVSHPNVCRVYDIGEVNGQHFLTMEYIDGEDLASLLRRIGRLPADKALETAHQICAGLAAAHDCGLLHRDLKPANIMLDGRGRVRITDFGLALSYDDRAHNGSFSVQVRSLRIYRTA